MRWAFWRARPPHGAAPSDQARPLPDDVGLRLGRSAARAGPSSDIESDPAEPSRAQPFSGAGPDPGGQRPAPEPVLSSDDSSVRVTGAQVAGSGPAVTAVVRAALVEDPDAVRVALRALPDATAARAAAVAAAGVLAARLPALSGVGGTVVLDEGEGDLLHAYADLLAERAEARRAHAGASVSREQLVVVAHLSAAAAVGDAAGEPSLLLLPGIPAEQQLLAGGVLLAQSCVDGGGGVGDLAAEVAELFG